MGGIAYDVAPAPAPAVAGPVDVFNQPPADVAQLPRPVIKRSKQGTHNVTEAYNEAAMIQASEDGDLVTLYCQMRNRLVQTVAECTSARDLPALSRAILNVGAEIERLERLQEDAELQAAADAAEDAVLDTDEVRALAREL